jgi:hypothetical protein
LIENPETSVDELTSGECLKFRSGEGQTMCGTIILPRNAENQPISLQSNLFERIDFCGLKKAY